MGDFSVRPVRPAEYPEWDQLVSMCDQGTVFHQSVWPTAIADAMNTRCSIQGCFSDDRIIGGYVLYHSTIKGLFKAGNSTEAMSSFGGLIVNYERNASTQNREKKLNAVVDAVTRTLLNDGFDDIQFELSPPSYDIRPFIWNRWRHTIRYTYIISPEMVTLSKSARRHIRRAEDADIVVEPSTDIDSYYTLYAETFMRQNLPPPMTREQMERVYRTIRESGMGEMWVARMPSGEWAAAEIQLYDEKRSYAWSAASDVILRKNGASYLLRKRVFDYEAGKGVKESYLYTANTPQLAEFMIQFGPKLTPHFQVWRRQGCLHLIDKIISPLSNPGTDSGPVSTRVSFHVSRK